MSSGGDFYRAFEDRHRGTQAGVEARQRAYLPFLGAMRHGGAAAALIDLGCGRGEWLSLARAEGWEVRGVDIDGPMLQAARDAGLDVHEGDALAFLRSQSNASCDAVTAFHVVEHLPFETLRLLLAECARVLRPGGLLLLETPNPENLVVGSSAFHMDPTHVRPLPPALLAFAAEFAGFDRVATMRLHEGVNDSRPVELIDVLAGVSPDYAIAARKPGGADAPALEALLAGMQGVTLNELADRYDMQLREIRVTAELAREAAFNLAITRRDLVTRIEALEGGASRLQEPGQSVPFQQRVEQVRERLAALEYQVAAMEGSSSWRLTAPLRRAGELRIRLANRVHATLENVPALHGAARAVARMLRLVPRGAASAIAPVPDAAAAPAPPPTPGPTDTLTASARRVHQAMKEAAAPQAPKET